MLVYYRHPPPHEVCLDDTCVFSHMVTQLQRGALLREGHLATCAHKIGSGTRAGKLSQKEGAVEWQQLVGKYYQPGPRTYACPKDRSNVSPFNIFEYLIHLKGNKEYFTAIKEQLRKQGVRV
eukprot:jgi/Tetstr1/462752/TSEL_007704.t1